MATLTIQLPGLPPVSHVLKDDTITVGRMKGNNIVIDDVSVSLTHARITRHGGEFYLKDLNSTNGTVVNGQRVNEARLRDLDRVAFADISAQFQAELAGEAASAAPAPIVPQTVMRQPQPAPAPVLAPVAGVTAPRPTPATPSRPAQAPGRSFDFARFMTRVVGVLGGAVALGVVSFLGWRMLHGGFDSSAQPDSSRKTAAALVAPTPAVANAKKSASSDSNPAPTQTVQAPDASPPAPAKADAGAQSVGQLSLALRDPDTAERRRAATTLHSLGAQAKGAAPALRAALDDADQDVRMWAALTLVNNELHDKATIPILIGVLQRENPVLRQVACLSLGLIPYEDFEKSTVVPALTETANKDGDDEVRKAAVSALNIIAPDAAAKVIIK